MNLPASYTYACHASGVQRESESPDRLLKEHYRAALLRHHPDKRRASPSNDLDKDNHGHDDDEDDGEETRRRKGTEPYAIDAVKEAYRVLSRVSEKSLSSPEVGWEGEGEGGEDTAVQGYSVVDLSDFETESHTDTTTTATADDKDEGENDDDDDKDAWTLPCRCGHRYRITQSDLEAGRDVVGCDGCSLRVRVTYRELDDAQDDER